MNRSVKPSAPAGRIAWLIARAGSSARRPHHAAFLDDLARNEPLTTCRDERRALANHVRAAMADALATPFLASLGIVLIGFGVFGGLLAPAPRGVDADSTASVVQQAVQVVSLVALAGALAATSVRRARLLMRVWIAPTAAAAIGYFFLRLDRASGPLAVAQVLTGMSQALILLGCAATLVGLRGNGRTFAAGWWSITAAALLYATADLFIAVAFVRSGDEIWVVLTSAPMAGLFGMFGCLVTGVPPWWQRDLTGEERRGRSAL